MKSRHRWIARFGAPMLAAAALLASAASAQAQSTWDGGGADNNWGTAANWTSNTVPVFPTDLIFAGTTRLTPSNNLGDVAVKSITFDATAGAFTIGTNRDTITLGDTNTADYRSGFVSQLDGDLQTINLNLTLSRGQHNIATATGAGGLTLNGAITKNPGSAARFFAAGGPIKTTLTNVNGMLGAWATIEQPSPAFPVETFLFAKVDGSGNVVPYLDYTADTNINGFAAVPETTLPAGVNATTNIRWFGGPTAAENLVLPAGTTDMNTLLFEGDEGFGGKAVMIGDGNTLRFSDGGGIFRSNPVGTQGMTGMQLNGGTITAGHSSSPATLYIWKNSSVNLGMSPDGEEDNFTVHFLNSVITDNPNGGPVTVVSTGSGGVRTEGAAHTFTGGLYINRGVWRAQNNNAAFGAGDVHVASGAQAYVQSDGEYSNDFFIAGTGIDEGTFFVGAVRCNADGGVLSGTWTLTADARMGTRGAEATNDDFATPAARGAMWTGKITGNHNLELNIKLGRTANTTLEGNTPTMILTNTNNDWTGNTTVGSGRLRIGSADVGGSGEVIPHGPGKGDLTLFGETGAELTILTLDSQTETVNGLFSTGDLTKIFVTNSLADDGTLKVGANDATSTFGGTIADHVGKVHLTKVGAGTLTLTGTNTYTGDTRVEGGVLSVQGPNFADMADVYLSGGGKIDLSFMGTDVIDSLFFNGAGQAVGTWGSLASTATNKSAMFTGSGILQVTTLGVGAIPGDFDGDGDVDGMDLVEWRNDFGAGAGSDADNDGDSDGADFLVWQRNLGLPVVPVAGAVPEPGTWALLGLAALGGVAVRRRRS